MIFPNHLNTCSIQCSIRGRVKRGIFQILKYSIQFYKRIKFNRQDKHRGIVGSGAADTLHTHRPLSEDRQIRVRRIRNKIGAHLRHLHHYESRIRGSYRAARQSEIHVQADLDDGAWQQHDSRDQFVLRGIRGDPNSRQKGFHLAHAALHRARIDPPIFFSSPFQVFTLYTLAQQQLSKQYHYDFGLRGIVTLTRYAGKKKRLYPNLPDEEVKSTIHARSRNFASFRHLAFTPHPSNTQVEIKFRGLGRGEMTNPFFSRWSFSPWTTWTSPNSPRTTCPYSSVSPATSSRISRYRPLITRK